MRIAIIGHFGGSAPFYDGQTIKTRTLYSALKRQGSIDIIVVDTRDLRKNPIKFFIRFIYSVIKTRKIIVLLSNKGRRFLFPVLGFLSLLGKEIYHYAIGARLADEVASSLIMKKSVIRFKANWVESHRLASDLQDLGINNATFLPNFKSIPVLSSEDLPIHFNEPFHFCTFSRIMQEKGISDAISAISKINMEAGRIVAILDIFGSVNEGYRNEFEKLLAENNDCCFYPGPIEPDKSTEVLKNYYMLLFPTHFLTEGMPGTIIDALSSGLPVIASDWPNCREMIEDKVTALIYPMNQPELLKDKIIYAIRHTDEIIAMKANCLTKAAEYNENIVIGNIISQLTH